MGMPLAMALPSACFLAACMVPAACFSTVRMVRIRPALSASGPLRPAAVHAARQSGLMRLSADAGIDAGAPVLTRPESFGTRAAKFGDFSWTQQWYPMAFAKVTDREIPHRLELFGEPLVLWWDQNSGRWVSDYANVSFSLQKRISDMMPAFCA